MEPMGQQVTTTEEQGRKAGPGGMAIPPALQPSLADQRLQRLVEQTVEQDVIPRLLLTRRDDAAAPVAPAIAAPQAAPSPPHSELSVSEAQVAELVSRVLAREEAKSIAFVEA